MQNCRVPFPNPLRLGVCIALLLLALAAAVPGAPPQPPSGLRPFGGPTSVNGHPITPFSQPR